MCMAYQERCNPVFSVGVNGHSRQVSCCIQFWCEGPLITHLMLSSVTLSMATQDVCEYVFIFGVHNQSREVYTCVQCCCVWLLSTGEISNQCCYRYLLRKGKILYDVLLRVAV